MRFLLCLEVQRIRRLGANLRQLRSKRCRHSVTDVLRSTPELYKMPSEPCALRWLEVILPMWKFLENKVLYPRDTIYRGIAIVLAAHCLACLAIEAIEDCNPEPVLFRADNHNSNSSPLWCHVYSGLLALGHNPLSTLRVCCQSPIVHPICLSCAKSVK